jgi:predicted RNA polymerase sigma factor
METGPQDDAARQAAAAVDRVWRGEGARLLGALARRLGDLDAAEDAAQEAVAEALRTWPRGVPPNPAGWLATTAWRRAVDRIRREGVARRKYALLAAEPPAAAVPDDLLGLLFGCCDPVLPEPARIALTLRAACGLTVEEIAAALLSTPAAVSRRLTRAKHSLGKAGVRFAVPDADDLPERLDTVLGVVYLMFNEGYLAAGAQRSHRPDLEATALHLGRELAALMPREPEAAALTALLELHRARAAARFDAHGRLVLLEDQCRAQWDRALIDSAVRRLDRAMALHRPGPYQIEAAIAALHAQAPDTQNTDWRQIRLLYSRLYALRRTPVVLLGLAVATRHVVGTERALAEVEPLAHDLAGYHLFHATRAEFLQGLAVNPGERELIARRLASLQSG